MSVYFATSSQIPLKNNYHFPWWPFPIKVPYSYTANDYRKTQIHWPTFNNNATKWNSVLAFALGDDPPRSYSWVHNGLYRGFILKIDIHVCVRERQVEQERAERDRSSRREQRERDRVSRRERDRARKREGETGRAGERETGRARERESLLPLTWSRLH